MNLLLRRVIAVGAVALLLAGLFAATAGATVFGRYKEAWLKNGTWTSANANMMTFNMMSVPNTIDSVRVTIWQTYPSNGSRTRIAQDYHDVAISGSMLTTFASCEKYFPNA